MEFRCNQIIVLKIVFELGEPTGNLLSVVRNGGKRAPTLKTIMFLQS